MARIVLASGNGGKLAELRELLGDLGHELVSQAELGIAPAPETGFTFIENALLKARQAARAAQLPAIADDSGLLVDGLGGAPGLKSARYAGEGASDAANIDKLLRELARKPGASRRARFLSVVVYLADARDPAPIICQGEWRGEILTVPRGGGGFGYDPVFFDSGAGLSAAEMDGGFKNLVSHRGRALAELKARLMGD
jgi:XTP/dITP diphosphohydrolase